VSDPFPSLSPTGTRRQARLADARLYVVTDARRERGDLEDFLDAICDASVDIIQLRDKTATEDELRAASDVFRRVAERRGALFVLNDLPGLAVQVGADGVHLGQEDVHPDHARSVVGPDLLIGRSTHDVAQIDATAEEDVDYFAVGPVHATPTKARRSAIGLDPVRHADRHASHPWFAIGGLTDDTVEAVLEAGARRIVVVRAVCDADDPAAACWRLRRALASYHLDI
jgi:thiamine-phosphate pyrophosphorylase